MSYVHWKPTSVSTLLPVILLTGLLESLKLMRFDICGFASAPLFTYGSRKQTVGAVECIAYLVAALSEFYTTPCHPPLDVWLCDFFCFTSSVTPLHFLHEVVASMPVGEEGSLCRHPVLHTEVICSGLLLGNSGAGEHLEQTESSSRRSNRYSHLLGGK